MASLLRRICIAGNVKVAEVSIQTTPDPYWFGVADGEQASSSHRIPAILPGVAAAGAAAAIPAAMIRGVTGHSGLSLAFNAAKNVAKGDFWNTGMQAAAKDRLLNQLKIPEGEIANIPKSLLPGLLQAGAGQFAGGPVGLIAASPRLVRDVANVAMQNPVAAKRLGTDAAIGAATGLAGGAALAAGSNLAQYEAGRGVTPAKQESFFNRFRRQAGLE